MRAYLGAAVRDLDHLLLHGGDALLQVLHCGFDAQKKTEVSRRVWVRKSTVQGIERAQSDLQHNSNLQTVKQSTVFYTPSSCSDVLSWDMRSDCNSASRDAFWEESSSMEDSSWPISCRCCEYERSLSLRADSPRPRLSTVCQHQDAVHRACIQHSSA